MSGWRPLVLVPAVVASSLLLGSFVLPGTHSILGVAAPYTAHAIAGKPSVAELDDTAAQLRWVLAAGPATDACLRVHSPPDALKCTPLHSPRISNGQEFFKGATYTGAETCKDCHRPYYDDWRKTWHSKMEQWPTGPWPTGNVKGDFNDRVITYSKIKSTEGNIFSPSVKASREDNKFYMTLLDKKNPDLNVRYEIAKVLGGNWDEHYEVKIGGRFYPTPMRWSVRAGDWITDDFPPAYHPSNWFAYGGTDDHATPKPPPPERAAEGRCAGCHTTGYEFKKIDGLWRATGNGEFGNACENCHGPASKHIEEAKAAEAHGEKKLPNPAIARPLKDLTARQQTQICAQCHGRAFNKDYPDEVNFQLGFRPGDTNITDHYNFWSYSAFSHSNKSQVTDYFWRNDWAKKNRQQWQDFTKSAHYNSAGMSCLTCHTFHGKWEGPQLRVKAEDICTTCHVKDGVAAKPNKEMYEGSPMQQKGVTCVDCHMPRIGKRSGATTDPNDPTKKIAAPWDTSSHTFLMASPSLEKGAGVRNACAACHMGNNPTEAGMYTLDELDQDMRVAKQFTKSYIERLTNGWREGTEFVNGIGALSRRIDRLRANLPPSAVECVQKARANLAKANQNLADVLLDGSFGFHNKDKSRDLLRYATDWVSDAFVWVTDIEDGRQPKCP